MEYFSLYLFSKDKQFIQFIYVHSFIQYFSQTKFPKSPRKHREKYVISISLAGETFPNLRINVDEKRCNFGRRHKRAGLDSTSKLPLERDPANNAITIKCQFFHSQTCAIGHGNGNKINPLSNKFFCSTF